MGGTTVTAPVRRGPLAVPRLLLEAMRPEQWTKNAFVLAGLVFSGRATEPDAVGRALVAAFAFCLISGATYLVNDVRDREADRVNPRTAGRPIARGDLSPRAAVLGAVLAAGAALALAAALNVETLGVIGGYVALQLGYSMGLKRVLFVDLFLIASGFLMRALAGLVAIDAVVSEWLLLATGLLALFLGLAKRRGEVIAANGDVAHRPVLEHYPVALLDELIGVITPCIVMVYALYTVLGAESRAMMLTLPFVMYGIFRVLYLIHHQGRATDDPSLLAVNDRELRICVLLWGVTAAVIAVATT